MCGAPIQMACYAGAIGTRGIWRQPHVVQKIRDKGTGQLLEVKTRTQTIELSDRVWDILHEGMYRCVNEPGGTALIAKVRGVKVAGKTGTAQNIHGKKDHAWFIGYAPVEHPKIAICVLIENAGFGGVVAAPIASMCIEQYLYGELIRNGSNHNVVVTETDKKLLESQQE